MLITLVLIITPVVLVVLSIYIHLMMLRLITYLRRKTTHLAPRHIARDVLIAMGAHILEITLFAIGMYILVRSGLYGDIVTSGEGLLGDYVYFSAVTYSTLGFGDITPVGALRILAGIEALTGMVLSAWTASIIFVTVLRYSKQDENDINW